MTIPTEAAVEDPALNWLKSLGWTIAHGPESPLTVDEAGVGKVRVVWSLWEEKGCIITHRRCENDKLETVFRSRTRP